MRIENEHSFREALKSGLNIFTGAGFSVHANDTCGNSLPVVQTLIYELLEEFELQCADSTLQLDQIAAILNAERKEEFRGFLERRFTVDSFHESYTFLLEINIASIFTTNIDNLIYKIFDCSNTHYLNDISVCGCKDNANTAVDFLPLHGSVVNPESELLFSSTEIATAFTDYQSNFFTLVDRLQRFPSIFWGYGVADSGVLQALTPKTALNRQHKQKWILMKDMNNGLARYYKSLGFSLIVGNTLELLDYFHKHSEPINTTTHASLMERLEENFKEYRVPDQSEVPVYPILDFFSGGQPQWYHIFSTAIFKTSHYLDLMDSVHSGRDSLIIGIPVCGKTTLLMQVAGNCSCNKPILMASNFSSEKARLLLRVLNGDHILLILDNFSDNYDALKLFSYASNVQLVAADREYNYNVVSHVVNKKSTDIISVTDLSDRDIQGIYNTIPSTIRTNTLRRPRIEEGKMPSIFEIVDMNMMNQNIRERYREALSRFRDSDLLVYELLLVSAYVHSCRTLTSMDMFYAFFKDDITSYVQIYSMIEKLGRLLTEYTDALANTDQDYYIPRSTIVSETIMAVANRNHLRNMLWKFHRNIAKNNICNYHIFKRRAYDADIAKKVFSNWEEGRNFYEYIYENRNSSRYILQQGALFLNHKQRYKEAFDWIDRALTETGRRSFSIRNSHAIILFKANIYSDMTPDVRSTLDNSMAILEECYHHDRRALYHATTFGRQALQYAEVFQDSVSIGYLENAKAWLETARLEYRGKGSINYLIRSIENKMKDMT